MGSLVQPGLKRLHALEGIPQLFGRVPAIVELRRKEVRASIFQQSIQFRFTGIEHLPAQCLRDRLRRQCQTKLAFSHLASLALGMTQPKNPFRYFDSSPEVIRLVVMMYVRYPLSLRNVEDLLAQRGIDICHETVRLWWNRFGPMFAAEIRKKRVEAMRAHTHWQWHLDEVYVKINGQMHYLWRAVNHEGEVLESFATKERDKKGALKFMKKLMKRHGCAKTITTDGLRSYGAAMKELGIADRQEIGRYANNRAENSHQPFRRRERAMLRFRRMKTLQKFSSVHAAFHNHFNQERHLVSRNDYKDRRSAAMAEWEHVAG